MTTTATAHTTDPTAPVRYEQHLPELVRLLQAVEREVAASPLDAGLIHLVKLRASQINGCAHCVRMHTTEARRDGETDERLDRLVAWRHMDDYSPAERAAFAWTEALTTLEEATDHGALRAELRAHYDETAISALTAAVAMINLWNRIAISRH